MCDVDICCIRSSPVSVGIPVCYVKPSLLYPYTLYVYACKQLNNSFIHQYPSFIDPKTSTTSQVYIHSLANP